MTPEQERVKARKSLVINCTVLGGLGSIFVGLCLKDAAWALVFVGAVLFIVGAAAARRQSE